jgi:hypothetical protein
VQPHRFPEAGTAYGHAEGVHLVGTVPGVGDLAGKGRVAAGVARPALSKPACILLGALVEKCRCRACAGSRPEGSGDPWFKI